MESSIKSLVCELKNQILSDKVEALVSPSAYDTAWLAMIPHQHNPNAPMFQCCLNWILRNQNDGGFWGEINEEDLPTIDALPATLACVAALKSWNVGHQNIDAGLRFIHSKAEMLLKINYQNLPRWFVLTFPAMIELAEAVGLHLVFPQEFIPVIADMFIRRHRIIETEEVIEGEESHYFPPLLSYLEALPSAFQLSLQETVNRHLSCSRSLFQSPSATAQAFMSTGNIHSLQYLQSLVQDFPNGVPARYPVDGDLIKLSMVDHVQGLGLAAHFNEEIKQILAQIYRNRKNEKSNPSATNTVSIKLFRDALAFRLLRMHRHNVHPGSFCWFLHEPATVAYMEENCEHFISAMYSVYRATDLLFPGETEMEEARKFAIKFLENPKTMHGDHNLMITKGLQNMIKYELDVPWTARLDRLYHRKWIEENKISPLWIGKASFYRLSYLGNKKLMQLAVENFEFQQSIFTQELEELKGWSKKWRLSEMGFGREKTVYTYFAIASCSCFPYNSVMRLITSKATIIVTVADDFYDTEGSLPDLEILTDAVERWDGEGLEGHSKTIFEALDDFVNDTVAKCHPKQGSDAVSRLQDLWRESFMAWMVERRWSQTGHLPSMDEYLKTGMESIAVHTIALPATSTFLNQTGPLKPHGHAEITKSLMAITRLANDVQSYQKEVVDGKMNMVLLHHQQHPNGSIEESVEHVKQMLEVKRKEFMQHVLMESWDEEMPESCKQIHLCCMKVFEMFFNSGNLFDNETALLEDINKSIYLPIPKPKTKQHHLLNIPSPSMGKNKQISKVSAIFKPPRATNFINFRTLQRVPIKFNTCFLGLPL